MVTGYTAPTQHQIGQSGIQFGGGMFQQVQLPDGSWGWQDPATGRAWDMLGNPRQQAQPAMSPQVQQPAAAQQVTQPAPQQAQSAAPQYVAGAPNTALQQNQSTAQSILDRLPSPNKVNVAALRRLPTSSRQFVAGAYAEKGYDPADLDEMWDRMLPQTPGPKRGYIAGLER